MKGSGRQNRKEALIEVRHRQVHAPLVFYDMRVFLPEFLDYSFCLAEKTE